MSCGEFDIISRFFTRQNVLRSDVTLGSGDDCALVKVAPRQLVATSTDTLVEGTHFFADISPEDLAYKSIMVNLSDLAAMGAEPAWLSLAITLSHVDERWLERFSTGFFSLLDYYQIQLVGGDTTKGPLSLTLTIQGLIPEGTQLTRSGAKVGDWIYVSGTLGDSAAGLAILQNRLTVSEQTQSDYLLERHLRPQARVLMGQGLRGLAHSAIDISDGLASDLGHILKASGCGAKLNIEALPMSDALRANASEQQALTWALSGGEDYELCFTVPEINRGALSSHLGSLGVPYTCIGQITNRSGLLEYCHNQKPLNVSWQGFDHFGEHHEQ